MFLATGVGCWEWGAWATGSSEKVVTQGKGCQVSWVRDDQGHRVS